MPGTPDPALLEQLRAALDPVYDIERELAGGMSRVFVATERALGRKVVIKVLPPELTAGVNRERFRREIQFAARLQHPHIVPLLTAGQVGEILYYTMPLVEGETLRSRLERERRLDASSVMGILQDVVDALAYAHARGLVHRDIKPENILLQRHHALVTDFGVAKAISESLPGAGATTVGIAVGTPAYMAPEQLAADPAADHRVDLYAIGLLAYELLSGSSPFTGSSPQQTLARQLTERPAPPHLTRADVPPALSSLIMRCLEKDPASRWASADELLQALGTVRITSSGMRAITPTERVAAVTPKKNRGTLIGGAVVVALLAAAGAWARWGPSRAAAPVSNSTPADSPEGTDSTKSAQSVKSVGAVAPSTAPVPSTLTRADSEAIAASVARRMTQKRPVAVGLSQQQLDSIRAELEHSVTDSVLSMLAASRRGFRPETVRVGSGEQVLLGRAPDFPVMEIRRPLVVALPYVADGSPDKTLGGAARAVTDSLIRYLRTRTSARLLAGSGARGISERFDDPTLSAAQRGADVLIQGRIQPVGDSVELTFRLQDARDPKVAKSLRHAMAKDEAAMLAGVAVPMIVAWIYNREETSRGTRTLSTPSRVQLDSIMRVNLRLRDLMRHRVPPRPDSAPRPPIP